MTRAKRISLAQEGVFDIIIVGGGIHGACICREAALRGYRVLLLEARDYAFGTSSRSSKMLHGGVRYLETGNIGLVHEALRERDLLLTQAPHLARKQRFLFPVIPGKTRPAWQIKCGLALYDFLGSHWSKASAASTLSMPQHETVFPATAEAAELRSLGLSFTRLFSYYDGQMDDARLVIENIIDSSALGAITLNYAAVGNISRTNNEWQVSWQANHESCVSRGRFLVNAAGSFVPEIHQRIFREQQVFAKPVFSRGTHLLFDRRWNLSGLILPTPITGRYYFVWPHFSPCGTSTLVGTTDNAVETNDADPSPTEEDISELLSYLAQDLPSAGLNKNTLYHAFSGIRILSGLKQQKNVSAISRELVWISGEAYLSFVGGKFTTARSTGEKALQKIDRYFRRETARNDSLSTRTRPLPGGKDFTAERKITLTNQLATHLAARAFTPDEAKRLAALSVSRFGSRAVLLLEPTAEPLSSPELRADSNVLIAEIRLAILYEQARTVDDVLRRRLGLALEPGEKGAVSVAVERVISKLGE